MHIGFRLGRVTGVGGPIYGRSMAGRMRKDHPLFDFTEVTTTSCGRTDPYLGVDQWDRNSNGDVINRRGFDKHMAEVGEEDQSVPGWDGP